MSEPNFGIAHDDDLPRTLRRERDARAAKAYPAATDVGQGYGDSPDDARPALVRGFDVPFFRLVAFFLKAAFAAIPALIVLGVLLWLLGAGLQAYFPQLVKMQIRILFPN